MKKTEKKKKLSLEDALKDASLSGLHNAIQMVHNKPLSQLMPKKHEMILVSAAKAETKALFNESPDMSIKLVITNIFMRLTDDISAPLMLKLTETIIEQWKNLSNNVLKENPVAVAA